MLSRNNYVPDVLDCLANLSSDEVFTPPNIVNEILDMLPKEIFNSTETTFLDPCSKSGVFLREITKRLLEAQIPDYKNTSSLIESIEKGAIQEAVKDGTLDLNDEEYEEKARKIGTDALKKHPDAGKLMEFEELLQEKLNHILTKQVFGIAITELTAQLSRRSLYCSKDASGRYSVCNEFGANTEGNIRFNPMKHTWKNNICVFCGASASYFDRPNDYESHAYELIHLEKPEEIYNMQFTVLCGNPPYASDTNGAGRQAKPIYNQFVEQAKRLNPKYLTMIIPSRWFSGGMGLDGFRNTMMNDRHITKIVDYTNSKDCFPGISVSGGVSYFLRERDREDDCEFTNITNGEITVSKRPLNEFNTLVRYNKSVSIIHKVNNQKEEKIDSIISSLTPYGLSTNYRGHSEQKDGDLLLYASDGTTYMNRADVTKGKETIDKYKVMISKTSAEHAGEPGKDGRFRVIPTSMRVLRPNEICTHSYFVVGSYDDEKTAYNLKKYLETKFVRFLMLLCVSGYGLSKTVFQFVPMQDFNQVWDDNKLFEKYGLTDDEIEFINSMIKDFEV